MRAALTIAAGLLAASSLALAASNSGNGNKGGKDGMTDTVTSGSMTDRFDPPDETTVAYCRAARIKDANCRNASHR